MSDDVPSPCLGLCRVDDSGEICVACKRTLEEIAGWAMMSGEEKKAVWKRIEGE
ncbi:DUF1289 domain-containing protein [Novosphingobium rosa]|uniref:DUF1289 domain-containing protein n=1 Tax=Novosphingobium rosa TaxID=76978 RepID=UPI000A042BBA|nr:DUF1289 domain-containing protein [Novosphingobium rosa]